MAERIIRIARLAEISIVSLLTAFPFASSRGAEFTGPQDSDRRTPPSQESERFQAVTIGTFRLRIPTTWTRTDSGGSGPHVFTKETKNSEKKAENLYLLSFQIPKDEYTCIFLVADTTLDAGGLAKLREQCGNSTVSVTNTTYDGFIVFGTTRGQRTAGATAEYNACKGNCIQVIVKAPLNTTDADLTGFIQSVLGRVTCARP